MTVPDNPYTRDEMYLSAIADGGSSGIPAVPYTRKEQYLAAIAKGSSSGIPDTPYTREEMYLDAIAKNGGGGGGGGGSEVLVDEFQSQDSGGSFNLQKTITVESAGNYIVTASGYCGGVNVSRNGTVLDNAFDDNGAWVHYFHDTLTLQAGDLLTINIWSQGRSVEYASVIKL